MQPQYPSYVVRSYSSGTFGRCLANAGSHHFVVDHATYQEGPGDQPGPVEYFLSGLTSCGVLMLEREARNRGIPMQWLDVRVEATRRPAPERSEGPATFEHVGVHFELAGPTEDQARELVEHYKRN